MTTLDSLKKLTPRAKLDLAEIAKWFDNYAPAFSVDTPNRKQAFFSQAAHETAGFNTFEEYASGQAYEGRKDLGNIQPGDGVKFKGRGIFQITGRNNYRTISKKIFNDERLINNPELLEKPEYAVLSALIFWNTRALNQYADLGTEEGYKTITRKINGGLNGWADRLSLWEKAEILF